MKTAACASATRPPPVEEGWGGVCLHTANAKSPTDAEQPFTEHAGHKPPTCKRRQPVAIPFTYTLSAQVYVKPTIGCALAHRRSPDTTTARIPAILLPSPCVGPGGGAGGGVSLHTANAKSSTDAEQPFSKHAGHKSPTCKRRRPVAIPFTANCQTKCNTSLKYTS